MYDDPKGGGLREELYKRISFHFQFVNVKKLFQEILHWITYRSIYGPKMSQICTPCNLFDPKTIDTCLAHDGGGSWKLKQKQSRGMQQASEKAIQVDEKSPVFANSMINWHSVQASALSALHSQQLKSVLEKFPTQKRLGDLKEEYIALEVERNQGAKDPE